MSKTLLVKYVPPALLFVGFLLMLSSRSQTTVPLTGSLSTVIPSVEGLRVTDQTVGDEERRIAGMSDYVARVYWRPDSTVAFTTYVGYYDRQTQGKTMHSPRNCLPGAGWEILKADTGSIAANGVRHVVNKYTLKNGATQALVLYWYQGRGRVVANEYTVKWNLLRDAALEGHTEEALVRLVIPLVRPSSPESGGLERSFADAERLGQEIGSRLLTDVSKVIPGPGGSSAMATSESSLAILSR